VQWAISNAELFGQLRHERWFAVIRAALGYFHHAFHGGRHLAAPAVVQNRVPLVAGRRAVVVPEIVASPNEPVDDPRL